MPDLLAVTKRTQEIVTERFIRWHEDLLKQKEEYPQEEVRAAYESVIAESDPAVYLQGREWFDGQYGSEAWQRQMHLHGLRDEKERAER